MALTTTAIASSVTPISDVDLSDAILKIPEEDFWKIVSARLNLQSQQNQIDANEHIEYLTEECLIDKLFLQLATTKSVVSHNGRCGIIIHKYYNQALAFRKWIPITRPVPAFVVNISDLSARIVAELKILDDPQIVLKQAVGRIFENIDARQYHLSIAQFLEVVLK